MNLFSTVIPVQSAVWHCTRAHTATGKGTDWNRAAMQNMEYAGVSA